MKQTAFTLALLAFAAHLFFVRNAAATQTDIAGPAGSGQFGTSVTVLPNGNIIVTDPLYDAPGPIADVGAVYLFNGAGELISTLTGSAPNDQVGSSGVTVLTNGNYVVRSPLWDNGAMADAGAATWCHGTTGCSGTVFVANSLVGSSAGDQISIITFALPNGHYVTRSVSWDNGAVTNAGAVTWCNGTTGRTGEVSSANSLVGSTANDQVGSGGSTILPNGNYVANSPNWVNGATVNAGAATWCDGTTGCTGAVSTANSLFGSTADDQVGRGSATALSNGNYVVLSPLWDNGAITNAGAATWCNGTTGCTGAVSYSNSLVGSTSNDNVGGDSVNANGATALTNGNYVVRSPNWDNGAATNAGAVTWCNGATGRTGAVSSSNSLVGSTSNDFVGFNGAAALANGNYVVRSASWGNGATVDAGAATWCDGTTGRTGAVSASNSLVGSATNDGVGSNTPAALTNGNYVVLSPNWNNGAMADVGAATWCNGTTGRTGPVSASNSLIGSKVSDRVGVNVTALMNGNYVVGSVFWANGSALNAGAATWCNGTTGRTGAVSASNSLVGSTSNDNVGGASAVALANGNYVMHTTAWDNGGTANVGAVTWCNGTIGRTGAISSANSLVGSNTGDQVGVATALTDGNYVVRSGFWDNGPIVDAGAITLGRGNSGTVGVITAANSVRGAVTNGGAGLVFGYHALTEQLVVGRPSENIVSLFSYRGPTFTVTTTDDHNDGACSVGDCTLREAIQAANALSDDNTITFASGVSGIIQLTGALPDLSSTITLQGPGANVLTVRRNSGGDYRIFTIANGTSSGPLVNLSGLTIANGRAGGAGFPANSGGGILNDHGTLTLAHCTLSGNNTTGFGRGGGIYNYGPNSGSAILVVSHSTLSGNSATITGGGIYSDGANGGSATLTVSNTTLSDNSAPFAGGGILNSGESGGHASLTVINCTLAGNNSSQVGGIFNDTSSGGHASLTLGNTLLQAGASGVNLVGPAGTILSQGHNLSSDAAGGGPGPGPGGFLNATGDIRNTDPQLDPAGLADNGGPTMTIALLSGSPAINAGDDGLAPKLDQRGFVRAGVSDIGAFEFGGLPLRILSISRLTNGHVMLEGSGVINGVHTIHASPDLSPGGFLSIGPATANGAGIWQFEDGDAAALPKRFYRASYP